jgi:hypothetical protein
VGCRHAIRPKPDCGGGRHGNHQEYSRTRPIQCRL